MPGRRAVAVAVVLVVTGIGLAACGQPMSSNAQMSLTSTAFTDGGAIPPLYSCDGEGVSPPLAWEGAPGGTSAFALLVTDPDAGGFVHWVLADVPGSVASLQEGEGDTTGTPGRNSGGGTGWTGPCPPSGEHRYEFRIFALSELVELPRGASADELRAAVRDRTLAEGLLTGTYSRR